MKRFGLAGVVLAVVFLTMVGSTWGASPIYLCLTEKAGAAKSGGVEGKCPLPTATVKYAKVALPKEESEQQTLLSILPHVKYVASGVGGKPTIQFSGVNVQVVNGEGKTATTNGASNLVVGYDENEGKHAQTGSHDLILGEEPTFTSFAGMIGGFRNALTSSYAFVIGVENTASGPGASVTGGERSTASVRLASVTGGFFGTAGAPNASVSGGEGNRAIGENSSVSGGNENEARGTRGAWVGGGWSNSSNGSSTAVAGGSHNRASGSNAAVSGGDQNIAEGGSTSVSGGSLNTASGNWSSIFGGKGLKANGEYEAIP